MQCGSCYAYAVVGAIEALYALRNRASINETQWAIREAQVRFCSALPNSLTPIFLA